MTVSDKLSFTFDGETYEFMTSMSLKDAILLKEKCGATTATVISYLDRRDPETIVAVAYIHMRAAGKAVRYEALLEKDVFSFDWAVSSVEKCDNCSGTGLIVTAKEPEVEEKGEDPTPPGKTPKRGTSKIG